MNKTSILITSFVVLLVGAASFYGGMRYQDQANNRINTMRGQFGGANGGGGNFQGRMGNAQGMSPVSGEIISQDDNSITLKLQDGSTKIIILSEKTIINKASAIEQSDLKTGETVTAFGATNSDGSITAQNISIGGMMFRSTTSGSGEGKINQ